MTSTRPALLDPAADRNLVLIAALTATATISTGIGWILMLALAVTHWLLGASATVPAPAAWPDLLTALLAAPTDLASPPGSPASTWLAGLSGHAGLYWTVTATMLLLAGTPTMVLIVMSWRRWGPTPPGHASRGQIRAQLSVAAARRTAVWTRPCLTPTQRRHATPTQLAAPLHRGPSGRMWVPFENPTGALAPTQSGKSRRDLAHKAIDAPGALLCSTTKPDLLELAGLARTRRPSAGPVLVYDATGTVTWPARLRWSPISGCTDPTTAFRRARAMVEAAAVSVETGGNAGNDRVFRERATMVLGAYLLAAALSGHPMTSIIRWATEKPLSLEPTMLLNNHYPALSANLRAETEMVARTADAVWMSVRRVVEPLMNPTLLALCTPNPGESFDAAEFITHQGSLFLIAGQHHAAQVAPLLTVLTDHWLTTAQNLALTYPTRRLDPPATAVLDELPNATPLPDLPDIISDSAGRGVLIHWAAQSLAQLEDTFTPARARQLLDNTTTLTTFGSLKDPRALEWLSTLAGHHDKPRYQHHTDGLLTPGRSSIGTETVPTYRPANIRELPPGQVIVIHRHLRPIQARTLDITKRTD
ncbi:MAG TPA: TraM recognition domain-containing protein, partial [Pseudonocardia sp.]